MLKEIYIGDSDIIEIPENAFHYDGGVQEHLQNLYIRSYIRYANTARGLRSIKRNAFSQFKSNYKFNYNY